MAEQLPTIPISSASLSRLQKAVTLASLGEFHEALQLLEDSTPGEFGQLEQAVRSFISDYRIAVDQSALSIEEFNVSKRDLEKKIQTIEEQRAAIQTLSAPIIDVWDGVVTIPLIGNLGAERMSELTERLLNRLGDSRTAWILLDLTGTTEFSAEIADSLLRLALAARLMGAQCLLTGMKAQAARVLGTLGNALEGLRSIASLKEGLKYCLAQRSALGGKGRL